MKDREGEDIVDSERIRVRWIPINTGKVDPEYMSPLLCKHAHEPNIIDHHLMFMYILGIT